MHASPSASFEGPEKKLKVTFAPDAPSLRAHPRAAWDAVLAAAGASVVAAARDAHWDAYVLSESSLFVSDHSATLITCGQTRLVDAVGPLLALAPAEALSQVLYARKSEHFPEQQPTRFASDAAALEARLGTRAQTGQARLGHGEHFVDLFHAAVPGVSRRPDMTLEVLMHGPNPAACALFAAHRAPEAQRRVQHVVQGLVQDAAPGFDLHEHYFEPHGYSVNGLRAGAYMTLHVTPEPDGSYVSFELQGPLGGTLPVDAAQAVARLAELFAPRSMEVLAYGPGPGVGPGLAEAGAPGAPVTWSPDVPGYRVVSREALDAAGYPLLFTQLRPSTAP
jgi:S-adenosylmethionine decarboxylase